MARIASTRLSRLLTGWSSEGPGPLPRRLADALRELAGRGDVAGGTVLPSQRELALVLGVSRSTVTAAYGLLESEGWLESVRGSGSRLRGSGTVDGYVTEGRLVSFDARSRAAATAGTADLSSGALPGLGAVGDAVGALTRGDLGTLLEDDGYHPYGIPALREGIATYYRAAGVPTEAGQILVTSGSQQAVWLVAQALVEPGDTVVVENPTYRGALEALRARGARLVPMGGDGPGGGTDGADVAALRRLCAHGRPRLVYLQPTAHNPTGRSLDGAARREWQRVLAAQDLFTVEDTACAELALGDGDAGRGTAVSAGTVPDEAAPVPLVAGLPMGSSVTVGTLSKLFWGGLRVGWVRASPQVVARLAKIKTSVDLSCSVVDQLVAVRLLDTLPEARARRRAQLRGQRDAAESLLLAEAPHWEWTRPAGGPALWVRVPGTDTETLAQLARRHGVSVVPGSAFSPVDGFRDRLRLPYAHGTDALAAALPTLLECAERAAG
ncbi:PLP-dependent aminotransferase family protein [Streptomyces sp. NBC_00572]|uniref:aminotransferase-like domain-containing protein n=1 Tax=Streptomyces sp. NBC_00572 TaxID=2903664 RepID=UPI00224EBE0A|nr:PLP-dependent aminotransferase family protein [Streptomyces sp. NBC_00572]MCX4986765.1 PLP-dependent aminotransferase family protein [Streptomyces sp. NBC_00572]